MEGNRNILVYGLPIVTLIVLGILLLHNSFPNASRVLLYVLLFLSSLFLIFLVLIQRGKGGGLAGALGGMGGSSAFGTRAGDVFTLITIVAASFWILSAMALAKINLAGSQGKFQGAAAASSKKSSGVPATAEPDDATDGEKSETPPSGDTSTDGKGKGILEVKPGKKADSDNNDSN